MSSTPLACVFLSSGQHINWFWVLMKLNKESEESWCQQILWLSNPKIWMVHRAFSMKKIFISDAHTHSEFIQTYATQNECMHQDSELKPDMAVATGTTTSIQVTTRQSTDWWLIICQSSGSQQITVPGT